MNVVYYKIGKFTKRNATKAHTLLLLLLLEKKILSLTNFGQVCANQHFCACMSS